MAVTKFICDVHVEIDLNLGWRETRDVEERAKRLEYAARDFMDFIRDHRSQDVNGVNVVREYAYKCSHCGWTWEHDNEKPECCEEAVREWATPQELIVLGYE